MSSKRFVITRPLGRPGEVPMNTATRAANSTTSATMLNAVERYMRRASVVGSKPAMAKRRADAMNAPGSASRGQVSEHSPQ